MPQPLSESDILFPHLSNNPNISNTLSSIKRSALSINNRLNSIISDSRFVASVAEAYGLPLVANERCGSWYIPLDKKTEGVYFKSTDGHMGQWSFSLRRLNLQLVDVVQKYGGAVVVDSTRRGKSMPDALSKTIPIWCCVLNRALSGDGEVKHKLYTPPHAVSESEHAQIESRIDGLVRQFLVGRFPSISQVHSDRNRKFANQTSLLSAPNSPNPSAQSGQPNYHPSPARPQSSQTSIPSSSAQHRAASTVPKPQKTATCKVQPTTTKHGATGSLHPCSGRTRTSY